MLQQLMVSNRFVSLATDDPDNSASEDTLYYDANDDTPYFLAGTEPPQGAMGCGSTHQLPGHRWHYLYLAHQMDAAFSSMKEIETPLGMDD